ncbi:MAG: S8 family serine peptidase, partial [Firmicutes bacterium]|nr:S8 family serine peptidase [Bacillota bacterium]
REPRDDDPPGYITQSGTSMAAPFVSRAAALLCQRFPGIDPATVKRILLSQARPLKDTPPEAQGRGILFP